MRPPRAYERRRQVSEPAARARVCIAADLIPRWRFGLGFASLHRARSWTLAVLLTGAAVSTLAGCISVEIPVAPERPRFAHYEILSEPPGAHVFSQDGTYQGQTPTAITLRAGRPSALDYSLRFVKEGFREKVYHYTARCDRPSEADAKKNPRKVLAMLEREPAPDDFDIPALPSEQRSTLAVIDFDVGEDIAADTGHAAADICREALATTARFKLMDRNNIRSILGEQDFTAVVRCDDTQCLVRYGRLLRVQQMVHGRISKLGSEYILHLGLTDVDTAELLGQITTVIPEAFEELRDIVPKKAFELVARAAAQQ